MFSLRASPCYLPFMLTRAILMPLLFQRPLHAYRTRAGSFRSTNGTPPTRRRAGSDRDGQLVGSPAGPPAAPSSSSVASPRKDGRVLSGSTEDTGALPASPPRATDGETRADGGAADDVSGSSPASGAGSETDKETIKLQEQEIEFLNKGTRRARNSRPFWFCLFCFGCFFSFLVFFPWGYSRVSSNAIRILCAGMSGVHAVRDVQGTLVEPVRTRALFAHSLSIAVATARSIKCVAHEVGCA